MNDRIAVIVEHESGRIAPATFEALQCAIEIRRITSSEIICLTVGEKVDELCADVSELSGMPAMGVVIPELHTYNGEAFLRAIIFAAGIVDAGWVCVAGTTQGLDLGPGLAARLGIPCVSAVERVYEKDSKPVFVKKLFNGKVTGEFCIGNHGVVISQPGCFTWEKISTPACRGVDKIRFEPGPLRTRVLGTSLAEPADSGLAEAAVIISAGRGIKRRENLELVSKVAGLFPNSSIAGSRPLCDDGWLPYRLQVGQTGALVAPELYVACGISGAQQHLVGMRGSKFVVAINSDPLAPIFNQADIGIVEDAESFLTDFLRLAMKSDDVAQP